MALRPSGVAQSGSSFEGGRGSHAADECAETEADAVAAAAAVEEGVGGGPTFKEPPADYPRRNNPNSPRRRGEEEGRTSSIDWDGRLATPDFLLPLFFGMVVADGLTSL